FCKRGLSQCPLRSESNQSVRCRELTRCAKTGCEQSQQGSPYSITSSAKQLDVQSVEHSFSVNPSGNFVFELPHASSNCVWVKFLTALRLAPLRFALFRLAPLRLARSRSAPLRLALFRLAPLRLAPLRLARSRAAPLRSAPLRLASLRSAP